MIDKRIQEMRERWRTYDTSTIPFYHIELNGRRIDLEDFIYDEQVDVFWLIEEYEKLKENNERLVEMLCSAVKDLLFNDKLNDFSLIEKYVQSDEGNKKLVQEALESALEALTYASGATVFMPGGSSHESWKKYGFPAIDKVSERLARNKRR